MSFLIDFLEREREMIFMKSYQQRKEISKENKLITQHWTSKFTLETCYDAISLLWLYSEFIIILGK